MTNKRLGSYQTRDYNLNHTLLIEESSGRSKIPREVDRLRRPGLVSRLNKRQSFNQVGLV